MDLFKKQNTKLIISIKDFTIVKVLFIKILGNQLIIIKSSFDLPILLSRLIQLIIKVIVLIVLLPNLQNGVTLVMADINLASPSLVMIHRQILTIQLIHLIRLSLQVHRGHQDLLSHLIHQILLNLQQHRHLLLINLLLNVVIAIDAITIVIVYFTEYH